MIAPHGRVPLPLLLATSLAAVAAPAHADIACSFVTECLEGEDCMDSGFTLTVETALTPGALIAEGGFPTDDRIVTDAETIPVTWAATGSALAAFGASASGFHMLSFDAEGAARYSAHLPAAELSLVYLGTCETRR